MTPLTFLKTSPLLWIISLVLSMPWVAQADPPPRNDSPTWFRKRLEDAQKKREEEALRLSEQPLLGGESDQQKASPHQRARKSPSSSNGEASAEEEFPSSENSSQSGKPIAPYTTSDAPVLPDNLLFRKEGLTTLADLNLALFSQSELGTHPAIAGTFAMGWWWSPKLVLAAEAHLNSLWTETYSNLLLRAGPMLRYYPGENWAFGGSLNLAWSQGLS